MACHWNGLNSIPAIPIDVLKSPPREFRTAYLHPLQRADAPRMEAHAMKEPLTGNKGTVAKVMNVPIRFDSKSQTFMTSKEVMHGGKSVTVSTPISNHGGTLQARGGSFAGGHGYSSGGSSSHGGGAGGSGGGSHGGGGGGGGGGSSGGGSHGGRWRLRWRFKRRWLVAGAAIASSKNSLQWLPPVIG